jgi:hypothetical protein
MFIQRVTPRTFPTVAALPITALLIATLTGCGNLVTTEISGRLGVTVDDTGQPQILVLSCDAPLTSVDASGDRTGLASDEENETLATWSRTDAADGLSVLDPAAPGDGWTGDALTWPTGRTVVLGAGSADGKVAGTSVIVSPESLEALEPGRVLIADAGDTMTRADFESCES